MCAEIMIHTFIDQIIIFASSHNDEFKNDDLWAQQAIQWIGRPFNRLAIHYTMGQIWPIVDQPLFIKGEEDLDSGCEDNFWTRYVCQTR